MTRTQFHSVLRALRGLKTLPWKALAKKLRGERDALAWKVEAQKRLLVWILNQIALERLAVDALKDLDEKSFDLHLSPGSKARGQA